MFLVLLMHAAIAASPCRVQDEPTLMRLADEFVAAEPTRTLIKRTDEARYYRRRRSDGAIEFTIVTVNEQPTSISYLYSSVRITVRGQLHAARASCAEARRILSDYLAATVP